MLKKRSLKIRPKNFSYRIQEKVAEGLSSNVYKALREYSKQGPSHTLALKVFKSKKDLQRWRKEFQSLSQISSPYCVKLLGWELLEGSKLTLVLEWIEGIHLNELFLMETLNREEIQNLCFQIHKGLEDLRNKNSFHGDLNPFNILINTAGQIKLIDFGMTWPKLKRESLDNPDFSIQGTLKFMAPELLKGQSPNYFSDLYSLGTLIKFLSLTHSKIIVSKDLKFLQPCLHLDPKKRKALFYEKKTRKIQNQLACKVQEIIKRKKIYSQKLIETKKLSEPFFLPPKLKILSSNEVNVKNQRLNKKHFKKSLLLIRRGLALSLCFLILFLQHSINFRKELPLHQKAHLIIATHHWFEISINGKKKGYSPLNLRNIEPGTLVIKARSGNKTYLKKIKIKAGEKIVLNDHFFNPKLNLYF